MCVIVEKRCEWLMTSKRAWAIRRVLLFVGASGLAVELGEPLVLSVVYGAVITVLFSLQTILGLDSDG